jgi:hypothetical protein
VTGRTTTIADQETMLPQEYFLNADSLIYILFCVLALRCCAESITNEKPILSFSHSQPLASHKNADFFFFEKKKLYLG